jgi:hypothetical protein
MSIFVEKLAPKYCSVEEIIKFCIIFLLPSLFSASQFRVWIPRPRLEIAFSPCVNSADSRCCGVGGGLGSPLAGFSPNTEIGFLMISPYLLDFCPVFLLYFLLLKLRIF